MKNLQIKLRRLNNSYESEPSSGSGGSLSEHHDNTISDDENMNLPYLLKPPSYQNEITVETTNPDSLKYETEPKVERDLRYGLSEDSSPDSPFEGFGESPYEKLKNKLCEMNSPTTNATSDAKTAEEQEPPPPPAIASAVNGPSPGKLLFANFYDIIAEENSCNAVDVILSNEQADSQVACSGSSNSNATSSELSFNGKIKTMCNTDESILENSTPLHQPLTIAAQRLPTLLEATLNSSYATESSFVLKKYTNEKSPDLFEDDDDDDYDDNRNDGQNNNDDQNNDDQNNNDNQNNEDVHINDDLNIDGHKHDADHKNHEHNEDHNGDLNIDYKYEDLKNVHQENDDHSDDHNAEDHQNDHNVEDHNNDINDDLIRGHKPDADHKNHEHNEDHNEDLNIDYKYEDLKNVHQENYDHSDDHNAEDLQHDHNVEYHNNDINDDLIDDHKHDADHKNGEHNEDHNEEINVDCNYAEVLKNVDPENDDHNDEGHNDINYDLNIDGHKHNADHKNDDHVGEDRIADSNIDHKCNDDHKNVDHKNDDHNDEDHAFEDLQHDHNVEDHNNDINDDLNINGHKHDADHKNYKHNGEDCNDDSNIDHKFNEEHKNNDHDNDNNNEDRNDDHNKYQTDTNENHKKYQSDNNDEDNNDEDNNDEDNNDEDNNDEDNNNENHNDEVNNEDNNDEDNNDEDNNDEDNNNENHNDEDNNNENHYDEDNNDDHNDNVAEKVDEAEETRLTDDMQMQPQSQFLTLDDVIEEVSEEQLKDELSTNKSLNCPTEPSFADDQTMGATENTQQSDNQSLFRANCRREKELLRRTRSSLSGVPPPPTVTIPKIDVIKAVLGRKDDILNFHNKDWNHQSVTVNDSSDSTTVSLLKPTHTLEQTQSMSWRDILSVRQHGLSFNLSKASESNEYLSLSVIDRFIGAETASSYQLSPSSAKKRNLRLKMLTASPGSRLSHLAKRRAVFSSANLATTSLKSTSSLGTQILLDKKKSKHRRKATPKRKTPGSKKKNVRKTPSSSARKRLYRCDSIKPGPSRETSKRALFQSPAKTLQPQRNCLPKPTIKPEIATRVEKSKRALFSPDSLSQNSSHSSYYNSYLGGDSSNSSHAYSNASVFSTANSSTQQLETLLQKRKRHRADDDDEDDAAVLAEAQNSKIFRGSMHSLTPRALQIKSQSFCIGAGSSAQSRSHSNLSGGNVIEADIRGHREGLQMGLSSSQMLSSRNNSSFVASSSAKLLRAQSENATMSSTANSLTENQRKKLLWAVSQALQEKKITAKHESFKEFASVLARVVRRIFQEYYLKGNASNSETMLRLAKKYAYNVIAGKNVDDIYFQAKAQIDEHKRKSSSRLSGYIAPEEYENHKLMQQKLSQNSFNGSMQNIFGTENSMDCLSMSISQTSVALSTTMSSITMPSQASNLEQVSQTEVLDGSGYPTITPQQYIKLPIQPNPTLQRSSSKSNLCGLALRENVDCEQRRSAQKNFTGKDQRNVSPYSAGGGSVNRLGSAVKLQSHVIHDVYAATAAKAKRQISFDS